jgi:uncharacterized Tic20 family protein
MAFEDAPPSDPAPAESAPALTSDDRLWAMLAHISGLVAGALGGMTFLGPLIVWLIKKDQSRFVDYHGKEALNFQLNVLIYSLILVAISIATCGMGVWVTAPLLGVLGIYVTVISIVAGVKANSGEYYRYPATFRLIK